MATLKSKDLIQSYILTTAKYDFNIYEKRLLYRLVEMAQSEIEGVKFSDDGIRKVDHTLWNTRITMPIRDILNNEEDKNYTKAKKAINGLLDKKISYEDENEYYATTIIIEPRIKKNKGIIEFSISNNIWNCCLDFSKGYRKYELKTAMQFESIYAMRFYELMSGQKKPISYSIEQLKDMFQIADRYERVSQFQLKVIDAAKRELDKCSPYTFTYEMNKTGRKFTSITLFPKYQPQFRDDNLEKHELQKQVSLYWDLPKEVTDYLIHNFEFTKDGIKNNIDLFKQANGELDLISFLSAIKGKVRNSNNPQGYVVGAIKKQLA